MAYQSINPFDNRLVQSFAEITDQQLEVKVAAATECFVAWKKTSYAHRAGIMARAAVLLHEQAEHFAQIMTMEMGKRISEARGEVQFSSQILTYYAENAERFLAAVKLHPTAGEAHMESSPIGVIFGVEP
ncbi:aldehyde dehydrogenase family protein [Paeniroseomonas aquatica]